jgi:hypothetical protein
MKPVLNVDKHLAILKSDHLRTRLQLQVSCRKEGEYASSRTPSALSLRHPAAPWALCVVLGIFGHFPCGRTRCYERQQKPGQKSWTPVTWFILLHDELLVEIVFQAGFLVENLVKLISEIARKAQPKRFKYTKRDLQGHRRRTNLPLRRNLFSLHEFEKYAYCLLKNIITIYEGNWTI